MAVTDLAYIDSAGYHYADYPSFLAYLTGAYQGIYGSDVYLGSDSQDGQWLGVVTQALYDTAALGGSTYNSFSPSTAQGVGLSRVVKINGLRRLVPSNSTAQLTVGGTAGTLITNGIAIDILNQQWALPASVTIGGGGTVSVTATAVTAGAIAAQAGTITGIFTPTQGWQTVTNPAAATTGSPVESDPTLRNRQAISTSIPANTVFDATIGAVANVAGVTAIRGYENDTDIVQAGTSLPAHSIAIVVEGGNSTVIAQTILDYKTPGTNTYGTTAVALVDEKGVPITINFFFATQSQIAVALTVNKLTNWVNTNETIIAAAIAAYINSIQIGGTIYLTQLYGVAYVPGTSAFGSFYIEEGNLTIGIQASGTITFTGTGTNSDTITVNGVVITLVTSGATGNQINIGASAAATAAALQVFLAASVNALLTVATYTVSGAVVTVTFIVPGATGNAFTLTKSSTNITLSGATLTGGSLAASDIVLPFNDIAVSQTSNIAITPV